MSVLINGMEMPKTAWYCSRKIDPDTRRCNYTGKEFEETLSLLIDRRCADCPLVEVPTPHGRLIDADAFDERVRVAGGMSEEELTEDFKDGVQTVLYMLSKQPPIIEAEGSEE